MLKRLFISGLGPHDDFSVELDPRGTTHVSGPSESGKTILIDAITFALWGRSQTGRFPVEAIRDGADRVTVELTLDSGRMVRRSMTRSRSVTRTIVTGGRTETCASEAAFAAALGDLGRDPETIGLVIVPLAWEALAVGNARKLRDALARILPEGDAGAVVLELMREAGYEDASPAETRLGEKEVADRRREARRARDQAAGRLQAVEERIVALETALVGGGAADLPEVDAALLERVAAWEAFDRATGALEARRIAEAAQLEHDRRVAALGPEPVAIAEHREAPARARAVEATLAAATQQVQQVHARHQAASMHVQGFAGHDPSVCPMCARPGWEQGAQVIGQMQAQLAAVAAELQVAQQSYEAAARAAQQARAAAQAAEEARAARRAWRSASQALGPRPALPEEETGASQPAGARPSPAEVAAARSVDASAAAEKGVRQQRLRDLEAAKAGRTEEHDRHGTAAAAAERLDALLEAVRAAPSAVAERRAVALGDLGPVSLRFGENPAVTVLIDGRPHWLASRGRRVVADACLRAGLRRALDLPWLPIIIDNVQDVGGQPLPEVKSPVVLLQTTDAKSIAVRRR